jgi:hypothetical protein
MGVGCIADNAGYLTAEFGCHGFVLAILTLINVLAAAHHYTGLANTTKEEEAS